MQDLANPAAIVVALFAVSQVLYLLTYLVDVYLLTLPTNIVQVADAAKIPERDYPKIVLFYPVLREREETMRTTLVSLSRIKYPAGKSRIIAIPNMDDVATIASLRRLQLEFPFLELLLIPPTSAPSWNAVWDAWSRNPKAYWWHAGKQAGVRDLPPKKTRQLIYALYATLGEATPADDCLVNYIDADSAPPPDHFLAAAAGMQKYDVLQAENVAGNLNASLAASWHAFDHMCWDGMKYRHLSANGRQPYWVLGKGLFFRASDLIELGGFHPWITIEDPEVGMRFWKNGRRLGVIRQPLIEEVPMTFGRGVTQRKRWVCGFFQSLTAPLDSLGFTPWEKVKAWMNFLPCLSLWINAIGFPTGVWALAAHFLGGAHLPLWLVIVCAINITAFVIMMTSVYISTWRRTGLVLDRTRERIAYMLRVNPLFVALWWVMWLVPLAIGFWMYVNDLGHAWERTEKTDANHRLIADHFGGAAHQHAT